MAYAVRANHLQAGLAVRLLLSRQRWKEKELEMSKKKKEEELEMDRSTVADYTAENKLSSFPALVFTPLRQLGPYPLTVDSAEKPHQDCVSLRN